MRVRAFLFVAALVSSSASQAEMVTLEPAIDGVQRRTGFPFPNFTYTTNGTQIQASFSQSNSHANVSVDERMFAMEFDLSTVPTGSVVSSAVLSWTETGDFLSPGNTHPLRGFVGDGAISVQDFSGPVLGQVANGTVDGRVSFDVTDYVAARVLAGSPYVGFSVVNDGYYQTSTGPFSAFVTVGTYSIASRLDADPARRPQLALTVVPEVSTLGLVGLSMGFGFVGFLRAQRPSWRKMVASAT